MNYYDISPLISDKIAVFPGDVSFRREVSMHIQSDHLELSAIHSTLHLGAHADAPIHYHKDGVPIAERKLDYYFGDAQVISVQTKNPRIYPADIAHIKLAAKRVLFKTNSFPNPNQWLDNFTALSPELIDYLAANKVVLVGIDTPSIDPAHSKKLESHQAVFKHDMAILEGLVLTEVPDNVYQLIALPLKIQHADASPVRAILTTIKKTHLM